jgi:GH25 family lysozyme M1 (1,4-beta-N-acetylmuramidase)
LYREERAGKRMRPGRVVAIGILVVLCCSMASATLLNGVDVSSWDGSIDWPALAAATQFAIIRSSCGNGYRDPNLSYNQAQARSLGMLRGYYHYCYPDYGYSATSEADWMLAQIGTLQPGEVLCLDYERPSYSSCVSWCKAFLDRVYAQTGLKPYIYMNLSTVNSYNWSSVANAGYPLWLAYWDGISNPLVPATVAYWGNCTMKQWNGEKSIQVGPLTNADVDVFNGNSSDWQSHGLPGWSEDTQPPTVPTNLAGYAVSATQVNLTWTASTDNVAVSGYKVYRNGSQIGVSATTSYSDMTCSGNNTYSYTVSAYDAAANESAQSSAVNVTTPSSLEWLTNGGFESGTTSGWTVYTRTGTPTLSIQTTGVSCGTYYLYEQLATLNTAGGVRQTVSGLTSGATYTISGAMKSVHSDVTVSVKVDTDGGTDYAAAEQTIASAITSGWQTFSASVTATGTSMTVFLDSSQSGGVSSSHVGAFDCMSLSSTGTSSSVPGQPTVAQVNGTTLSVANNASDSSSGYYAFRINDGSACSNKFVQSDGAVGASPVWQTKTAWGTKNVTGLAPNTSYTFDVAGATSSSGTNATSNRYLGTYVGSPTLGVANKWGSGDTGAAFDGSSQYVSIPSMGTDVNLSGGFTIECWANPSATGLAYPVIQLTDSTNYSTFVNHICFDMSSAGALRGEVYQSGGCGSPCYGSYYVSPSLSFTTGSWHHYAMVVSAGGTLTFYKDGVADAGQALLYMPSNGVTRGKVMIGRRDTTSAYYWHGSLDDVAIYDYALSSARISAHYNAADAALYNTAVVTDNPVGYWRLGESSGTAAADSKGGYSLSATGSTTTCATPTAPTSASASPSSICSGSSSTLTATGGSGTSCKWYTGTCGGTLAGTGTTIVVSPTSTATYYARWESACGNSSCVSATVTVNTAPSAPTDGTPTADSTTAITWKWTDVSSETGYRVKDTGGTAKSSDLAANTVQWQETGLTPNTSYTRKIYAFNSCGESTGSTGQTKYTLAKAGESTDGTGSTGNVYCTTATKNTWYAGNKTYTFTNPAGFGAGGAWKASSFEYKWNKTSTETWSTAGTAWSSGTLSLTATSGDGDYYLHVRAINGSGTANNTDIVNYGPFRSDGAAPSTVTVDDKADYTPLLNELAASWSASSDSGSGLNRYEYAVGTSSSTQDIKAWTSNGTATFVTITGLDLADGGVYWVQVRAVDDVGNISASAYEANGILAAPGVTPIGSTWQRPNDAQPFSLRDKFVTARIGNDFWLEEENGSGAIKVHLAAASDVSRGNKVSVAGVLHSDGVMRYLDNVVFRNFYGSYLVRPLGVTCKWLGGGAYKQTATSGVTGGQGLYNIGLLVRCCGRVSYSNTSSPSAKYFYLDDGSGLSSDGHSGVKVACGAVSPPASGTAVVTGIVGAESIGGTVVPVLMIRDGGDILTP